MESEKHMWTCPAGIDENGNESQERRSAQGLQGTWGAGKDKIPIGGVVLSQLSLGMTISKMLMEGDWFLWWKRPLWPWIFNKISWYTTKGVFQGVVTGVGGMRESRREVASIKCLRAVVSEEGSEKALSRTDSRGVSIPLPIQAQQLRIPKASPRLYTREICVSETEWPQLAFRSVRTAFPWPGAGWRLGTMHLLYILSNLK